MAGDTRYMRWGPPQRGRLHLPPVKGLLAFVVITAAVVAPGFYGIGVGAADDMNCADAKREVTPRDTDLARRAVLCLINRTRAEHGRRPLRESVTLEVAAIEHSKDMVRRHFFAHDTPDGVTPGQRMERAGYRGRLRGENLAYGSGEKGTPAEIMDGWMHSPGHRRNILEPRWLEIGIGVTTGAPGRGLRSVGATYTTDFGAP